jgi:hypothetical protein
MRPLVAFSTSAMKPTDPNALNVEPVLFSEKRSPAGAPLPKPPRHYWLLLSCIGLLAALTPIAYSIAFFPAFSNGMYMTMTDHVVDQYDLSVLFGSVLPFLL